MALICCTNCFRDYLLKKFIKSNGTLGNCGLCGGKNVMTIEARSLGDMFSPIFSMYVPVEGLIPNMPDYEGDMIWDIINEKWSIFSDGSVDRREDIIREICADYGELAYLMENCVVDEAEFFNDQEEVFDKYTSLWCEFANEIKYRNRYFVDNLFDCNVLDRVLGVLVDRSFGSRNLYRARKAEENEAFEFSDLDMPPGEKAKSGRANPVGISYLYLATNPHTALAEVRPKHGEKVGIARFKLCADLKLIDLSVKKKGSPFAYGSLIREYEVMYEFLRFLGIELSRPVGRDIAEYEYVPSQYLCEYIKKQGYDGVIYRSQYARGKNIAIFNKNVYTCERVKMYRAQRRNKKIHMTAW